MDKNYLIKLLQDQEISAKLRKSKSPQQAYEVLKGKVDMSFDDFKKVMTDIKDSYSDQEDSLLKREDVQSVLNCCDHDSTVTTATTVTTVTASASAADY
ncbi:MAG: hypothetical protein LKI18_03575 [Prevotella sp.]|jgi:Mg2+ and Co2+ transporter CorA|nr:hypothetical protein [Prevotella sp.]